MKGIVAALCILAFTIRTSQTTTYTTDSGPDSGTPMLTTAQSKLPDTLTPPVSTQVVIGGIQERAGNSVVMDDSFEYAVLDYGVGQFQVRSADRPNSLSPNVFWVKLGIRNTDLHLIKGPRYITSAFNPIRVKDNWANTYWLRRPEASDVGGNWFEASLPIPDDQQSRTTYKPGDSSWDLRVLHLNQLVDSISELQIYLVGHEYNNPKAYFFRIAQPLARHGNLMRNQADPDAAELQVKIVTETLPAPIAKREAVNASPSWSLDRGRMVVKEGQKRQNPANPLEDRELTGQCEKQDLIGGLNGGVFSWPLRSYCTGACATHRRFVGIPLCD